MMRRAAHRGVAIAAVGLLALLLLPAAHGLHGTTQPNRVVCGQVVNEAGWPLAGVTLAFAGTSPNTADHVLQPVATGPDGRFQVTILAGRYQFLFADTLPPEQRAGASYAPHVREVNGAGVVGDACGTAPLSSLSLGNVVLDAPHVGFVEVTVRDAAVGAAARVGGAVATVKVPALGPLPANAGSLPEASWGSAPSSSAGLARVTCPLQAPVRVEVAKAAYATGTSASFPCQDRALLVDFYRAPVTVAGTVTDADNASATLTEVALAAAPATFAPVPGPGNPYLLAASSGGDPDYELRLPWGDAFTVTASKPGYVTGTRPVAPSSADLGAVLDLDFLLDRRSFPLAGRVEDVFGAGIAGASLAFAGRGGLADAAMATSGPDGSFGATLLFGHYDLTLTSADKNTRSCVVTIGDAGAASYAPASCLRLVRAGSGALQGTVRDPQAGLGIPGATAQVGSDASVTGADGKFLLEVPAGAVSLALSHPSYQSRSDPHTVALDQVLDVGARNLSRTLVDLLAQAQDDGGSNLGPQGPPGGARMCVTFLKAAGGSEHKDCKVADAAGAATFPLAWTRSAALGPAFDTGDYRVAGARTGAAPIYQNQTCVAALDLLPGPPHAQACPMRAVDGITTVAGPFTDAHTGLALPGVLVTATNGPHPCAAPYRCSEPSGADGRASLFLPAGFTFNLTASRSAYQAPAGLAGVAPGSNPYPGQELARTARNLTVTVLDAHTGGEVEGVPLEASAAFDCDPGLGGFDCEATTGAAGMATLRLPWGAFTLASDAGSYDVVLREETEAGAAFEAASRPLSLQAGDGDLALDPPLRLLRAPGEPITGSLRDHRDEPTSAPLLVTLEREGFDCQPAAHDGPARDYGDCALDGPVGSTFTLDLPHGTLAGHAWTVEARKPGHFPEARAGAGLGAVLEFELWPLAFDLVVEPRDPLTGQTVPETSVCLLNLDQAAQGLPSVPVERCLTNGPGGGPVTFPGVTWLRNDLDGDGDLFAMDEGDTFSVRASQFEHVGQFAGVLGPGRDRVVVEMAPLFPTVDASDDDGDAVPASAEALLRTDPSDPASHPLNDGTLRGDLNDGFSIFLSLDDGALGPAGVQVQAAHGAFTFRFAAERYPTHLLGGAEAVPAPAGTPVAFALFDASFVTRQAAAAAAGQDLGPWRDHALVLLQGSVGDGTFEALPGDEVRVRLQAEALPTLGEPVVAWAWMRAGAPYETPVSLGPAQPVSGYLSLARNAVRGSAAADKLDWAPTPLLLAAASAGCTPDFPTAEEVRVTCDADSAEGSAGAVALARIAPSEDTLALTLTTHDALPGAPLAGHRLGVALHPGSPMGTLAEAQDPDGDGAPTLDELAAGTDPTMPAGDGGFPAAAAGRVGFYAQARLASAQAWLGL